MADDPGTAPGLRTRAASIVTAAVGARPVAAIWRRARPGLRILAYHDVTDRRSFVEHIDHVVGHYTPVSGAEVVAARHEDRPLPRDAVWITFDDGDPSVVANAQPALVERGVTATLFVCPGLISAQRPPWWSVVLAAGERGVGAVVDGADVRGPDLVTTLKTLPDERRREMVAELEERGDGLASAPVLTVEQLEAWQGDGLEVGNHTWDHPCLDRCTPEEQTRQIEAGHEWLVDRLDPPALLFAYPNGDRTDHARAVARRLGYEAILLFDHRLNGRRPGDELSRLRLDASAPADRLRAVVSGAHSDVFSVVR